MNDDDSEDVDVEYVDPTYYSRAHVSTKKVNRSRGQNSDMSALDGRKSEQKRNINSLFQPQSPLISENMKVSAGCVVDPTFGRCYVAGLNDV
jgi:hypothetical protein